MPPKSRTGVKKVRRKERKNIAHGHAHIKSTFNNTIVSISDPGGSVIAWASSGQVGFKGSRKSTPYAAQMAAEAAARKAMNLTPTPADPTAPGPFGFADDERLRTILSNAGYGGIDLLRFDAQIFLGSTPRAAAGTALRLGPTARLVREVGAEHEAVILDAVEAALMPMAAPDGGVSLNGSAWIVSATSP